MPAYLYNCISVDVHVQYFCTGQYIPQSLYIYSHSVKKLKELIKEQTNLDPYYQELFYENLPYYLGQPEPAAKLPITTVRAQTSNDTTLVLNQLINSCAVLYMFYVYVHFIHV